ncbi:MAG: hypothetical protein ACP5I8_05995 [Phycisphaerae bacterium]
MANQFVVLCEDEQQAYFIRRFLRKRGWTTGNPRISKTDDGSGEQYVRENFPRELGLIRRYPGERRTLIVITDADNKTVAERIDTLRQECQRNSIEPPGIDEPVFFMVPKWQIENWLAYLRGEDSDENHSTCRRYSEESDAAKDVDRLVAICQGGRPDPNMPSSLAAACREYRRFERMFTR